MTKHKSPLAGRVPPPTPSAAVAKAAEQIVTTGNITPAVSGTLEARAQEIVGERDTTFSPVFQAPYEVPAGLHSVQVETQPAQIKHVFVPRPVDPVTILFKFFVVDEGEIEYTATFSDMADANAWLDKVKREGVTLNSKSKPQAEWYSPYFIRKVVAKPVIPEKVPSAS